MGAPTDGLSLYNNALLRLKQKPITSFNDTDNDAAIIGASIYDQTRQQVLQAVAWNCARNQGAISLSTSVTPLFDFIGAYGVPSDLLALRQLGYQYMQWLPSHKYSYDIVAGFLYFGRGNVPAGTMPAVAPPSTLHILYTMDLQDVTKMDALLRKTLIRALAAEAAFAITGDLKIAEDAAEKYEEALIEAEASNRLQRPIIALDRNPISEAGWNWASDDGWDGQLIVPSTAWPLSSDPVD